MYRQAAGELGLDFEKSYFIGDKLTDVVPAIELGGRGILVRTGYGTELEGDAPEQIAVVDDLQAAAAFIVKSLGR
jgi:histidinol phosphatase-like enzyme